MASCYDTGCFEWPIEQSIKVNPIEIVIKSNPRECHSVGVTRCNPKTGPLYLDGSHDIRVLDRDQVPYGSIVSILRYDDGILLLGWSMSAATNINQPINQSTNSSTCT